MLEWFHQLHEVLDTLVTDKQTPTLNNKYFHSCCGKTPLYLGRTIIAEVN